MKYILALSLLALITTTLHAQVSFNNVAYYGTGCRKGSVSTVISPDGETISILFDEFRAEVPQYDGDNDNAQLPRGSRARARNTPTVSHKNCSLSFLATLQPGIKFELIEVSMQTRGAAIFDEGIEGSFVTKLIAYTGAARGPGKEILFAQKSFRSNRTSFDKEWTESPSAVVPLASPCSGREGREIRFEIKNQITVETLYGDEKKHGMIIVDSSDVSGVIKFKLKTRACGGVKMSPKNAP